MADYLVPWFGPKLTYALAGVVVYTSICHILRFRRIKSLQHKYGFFTAQRPTLAGMTDQEAWEIQTEIDEAEFPALFEKGLQLALFRTYGIPSISKLLVQTAQLSTSENVAKRYADTAVIITEIYADKPTSETAIEAFARLNYLHGHYLKQGRITNDDMLYTLALFMNHPCEWINRYEWRRLTDMEVCAVATFHKSMGDAMQIKYDVLPGSKSGWKDGLQFYQELDTWAKDYEKRHMVPHKDNYDTAIKTRDLMLSTVPSFTRDMVAQIVSAAMDDRLREAVMFEPAYHLVAKLFSVFMTARRFYLRHLALPRFSWQRQKSLSKNTGPEGRRWLNLWSITPHYVKPTIRGRWGPSGIYRLILGAPRPGDKDMCLEGYLRSDVGPRAFSGKGKESFEQEKSRLAKTRTGGCPFVTLK